MGVSVFTNIVRVFLAPNPDEGGNGRARVSPGVLAWLQGRARRSVPAFAPTAFAEAPVAVPAVVVETLDEAEAFAALRALALL